MWAVTGILLLAGLAHAGQWQQSAAAFARGTHLGTEVDSAGALTLGSFKGANLALGAAAQSGDNPLTGSRSVTDGEVNTEWRFNNESAVLGEWIKVDLGGDRGVSRVRLRPGKTIVQRPLFFIKGYRIEVASEAMPDDWVLVAQQVVNGHAEVDTQADSTWLETDVTGRPLPVLGRYVRLKLVREEPPNWVTIGEVEVYGEGYRADGSLESEVLDAGRPVNLGTARVTGVALTGTEVQVQFRTSLDGAIWAPWTETQAWDLSSATAGVALTEPEPARYLQYRVALATTAPLRTPRLTQVSVTYDTVLFAQAVTGAIAPLRPVLGQETAFTYTVEAEVGPADLGFDRVRLALPGQVTQVRWQGVPLPAEGYSWFWDAAGTEVVLDRDYRVSGSGRLEVDLAGVLLRPTLAVRAGVALSEADNWQNLAPASSDAWTLIGLGTLERVLPRRGVQISPNPFNAARGPTQIQVDLAQVQVPQPVTVAVYTLAGRPVRRLVDGALLSAGRQRFTWDGRDDQGRLVGPGLYLLRVEVQADVDDVWTGLVGVVY
ncbi:MAG: discoidin domain-containing protein [Candidatus Latescibacterota bacterium]|jgi:hypothetical protein